MQQPRATGHTSLHFVEGLLRPVLVPPLGALALLLLPRLAPPLVLPLLLPAHRDRQGKKRGKTGVREGGQPQPILSSATTQRLPVSIKPAPPAPSPPFCFSPKQSQKIAKRGLRSALLNDLVIDRRVFLLDAVVHAAQTAASKGQRHIGLYRARVSVSEMKGGGFTRANRMTLANNRWLGPSPTPKKTNNNKQQQQHTRLV